MKLLGSNPWRGNGISRVLGALFYYSTGTGGRKSPPINSLYLRISQAGNPRVPIIRVLDQWLEEGRHVQQSELLIIIKQLRKYRRYSHALQVSFPSIFLYIFIYLYVQGYEPKENNSLMSK